MQIIYFNEKNKARLNEFVASAEGAIEQSYEWGEFQQKVPGRGKFWAIGVEDGLSEAEGVSEEAGSSEESGKLLGSCLVIRQRLPMGLNWLYVPRGPVMKAKVGSGDLDPEVFAVLWEEIQKIARAEKAVFVRVEPAISERVCAGAEVEAVDEKHPWAGVTQFKLKFGGEVWRYNSAVEHVFKPAWYAGLKMVKGLKSGFRRGGKGADSRVRGNDKRCGNDSGDFWQKYGFRKAHASYQPEWTLKIDLEPPPEEILKQMKSKGRYNIRVAEKKGVKVREFDGGKGSEKAVRDFYQLLTETTERDQFHGHGEKFYQDMLGKLGPAGTVGKAATGRAKLYLAEYQNEVVAGILVTFFGDTATYYYGASGNKHRNVMAPYLLQWEAMRQAKKQGLKWYDLLGVGGVETD